MTTAPESAVVTITAVTETKTLYLKRRFVIDASKTTEDPEGGHAFTHLSLTTLDVWKAAMCDQAMHSGRPLAIEFRDTGYWDKDLLSVEFVKDEQVSA